MSQFKSISIPQPCHQSWKQMTSVEKGRHCRQCSKLVIDFTKMSNNQIIDYLSKTSNVCGRLEPYQLNTINHRMAVAYANVPKGFQKWMMAVSLLSAASFLKVSAQTKAQIVQTPVDTSKIVARNYPLGKIAMLPDTIKYRHITGRVFDVNDNTGLPGAVILVQGIKYHTQTNSNGQFNINIPVSAQQFTINLVGYSSQTIDINQNNDFRIKLRPRISTLTGEIVVIQIKKRPFFKRLYYHFIKIPIRKIFS